MISEVKATSKKDAYASWWWIEALKLRRLGATHREIGEHLRQTYHVKKGFDAETVQRALKHRLPEAIPQLKNYLKEWTDSFKHPSWKASLRTRRLMRLEGMHAEGKIRDGYSLGPRTEVIRNGLKLAGKKYCVDEKGRAPEIRLFWKEILAGGYVPNVAKSHDIPLGSAYPMLRDRFYIGEINIGTEKNQRWVRAHPALIETEIFEKTRARFIGTAWRKRGASQERREWIGAAGQLACEGKASPEIAEAIGVTPRVVDHWLTDKSYRKYLHPDVLAELRQQRKGGNWRRAKKIRAEILDALEKLKGSASTPQLLQATGRSRKESSTVLRHLANLQQEGVIVERECKVGRRHLATTWTLRSRQTSLPLQQPIRA